MTFAADNEKLFGSDGKRQRKEVDYSDNLTEKTMAKGNILTCYYCFVILFKDRFSLAVTLATKHIWALFIWK